MQTAAAAPAFGHASRRPRGPTAADDEGWCPAETETGLECLTCTMSGKHNSAPWTLPGVHCVVWGRQRRHVKTATHLTVMPWLGSVATIRAKPVLSAGVMENI